MAPPPYAMTQRWPRGGVVTDQSFVIPTMRRAESMPQSQPGTISTSQATMGPSATITAL